MMRYVALSLIFLVFVCLCSQPNPQDINQVKAACVNLCKAALDSGQYLSNGPCLSDATANWKPNWSIDDWVCDVAHSPRQAVDNMPENQCHGNYHHFIEVYANCSLIRVV